MDVQCTLGFLTYKKYFGAVHIVTLHKVKTDWLNLLSRHAFLFLIGSVSRASHLAVDVVVCLHSNRGNLCFNV